MTPTVSKSPTEPTALAKMKARVASIRRRQALEKERAIHVNRLNGERDAIRSKIKALETEAEELQVKDHAPEDVRNAAIRAVEIPMLIKAHERQIAAIVDPPQVEEGEREFVSQDEALRFVNDVIAAFVDHRIAPVRELMATWGGKAPEGNGFVQSEALLAACPILQKLWDIRANSFERGAPRETLYQIVEPAE